MALPRQNRFNFVVTFSIKKKVNDEPFFQEKKRPNEIEFGLRTIE